MASNEKPRGSSPIAKRLPAHRRYGAIVVVGLTAPAGSRSWPVIDENAATVSIDCSADGPSPGSIAVSTRRRTPRPSPRRPGPGRPPRWLRRRRSGPAVRWRAGTRSGSAPEGTAATCRSTPMSTWPSPVAPGRSTHWPSQASPSPTTTQRAPPDSSSEPCIGTPAAHRPSRRCRRGPAVGGTSWKCGETAP